MPHLAEVVLQLLGSMLDLVKPIDRQLGALFVYSHLPAPVSPIRSSRARSACSDTASRG